MPFDSTISNIFVMVAVLIEAVIVFALFVSIVTDSALERRQRRADLRWLREHNEGTEQ